MQHINNFLALGKEQIDLIVPIINRNPEGVYFLSRDQDKDDPRPVGWDMELRFFNFGFDPLVDMANRARAVYMTYFGGQPCELPAMHFITGAQMIVRLESIISKPQDFWKHVLVQHESCPPFSWDWERMWVFAFDVDTVALPIPQPLKMCEAGVGVHGQEQINKWKTWDCSHYPTPQTHWSVPKLSPSDA